MKNGRPSHDEALLFPNRTTELRVAKVRLELANKELIAKVWCVKGFVFSIEYEGGGVSYFEEAAGMDPVPQFNLSCEMMADLAQSELLR